jgi:adenosylcobinamide-phosphate synthase
MMLLSFPLTATLSLAGVLLDRCFGEPRRAHPLIGFGKLAVRIEARLNTGRHGRAVGVLAWLLAVLARAHVFVGVVPLARGKSAVQKKALTTEGL